MENVPQQIPEFCPHGVAGSMFYSDFYGSALPVPGSVRTAGGTGRRHRIYFWPCMGAVLWQSAPGYRPGHRIPNPGTSAELQGTAQGQHLPFFLAGVCDELPYGILPV